MIITTTKRRPVDQPKKSSVQVHKRFISKTKNRYNMHCILTDPVTNMFRKNISSSNAENIAKVQESMSCAPKFPTRNNRAPSLCKHVDLSTSMALRKRVSFHQTDQVQVTSALDEFTPDEISSAWYTFDEYFDIKRACWKQLEKMEKGVSLKGVKYSARGLENHTRLRSLVLHLNRSHAIAAVLLKQEDDSAGDDEALARVYRAASASSQLWASTVGLQDQREAERILEAMMEELSFSTHEDHFNRSNHDAVQKSALPPACAA